MVARLASNAADGVVISAAWIAAGVLCLLLVGASSLTAQEAPQERRCLSDVLMGDVVAKDPRVINELIAGERKLAIWSLFPERAPARQGVLTVPVVVHVVHQTPDAVVPDHLIHRQIEVLNQDYRRMPGTPGWNEHLDGADTEIMFRLARLDPKGEPTTGITRTKTSRAFFSSKRKDLDETEKALKTLKTPEAPGGDGEPPWDCSRYLNVWVCVLRSGEPGKLDLGFAEFPWVKRADRDGVVVDVGAFGPDPTGPYPAFRGGRTLTHEVGHWLGLHHVWGELETCASDDFVDDTPPCSGPNLREPTAPRRRSCGHEDMIENFLDYTPDQYMNIFTNGQVTRMEYYLLMRRAEIMTSRRSRCSELQLRVTQRDRGLSRVLTLGVEADALESMGDKAMGEVALPGARGGDFDPRLAVGAETGFKDVRPPSPAITWKLKVALADGLAPELALEWDLRDFSLPGRLELVSSGHMIDLHSGTSADVTGTEFDVRFEATPPEIELRDLREAVKRLEREKQQLLDQPRK